MFQAAVKVPRAAPHTARMRVSRSRSGGGVVMNAPYRSQDSNFVGGNNSRSPNSSSFAPLT
jgi:hypothetical protein